MKLFKKYFNKNILIKIFDKKYFNKNILILFIFKNNIKNKIINKIIIIQNNEAIQYYISVFILIDILDKFKKQIK